MIVCLDPHTIICFLVPLGVTIVPCGYRNQLEVATSFKYLPQTPIKNRRDRSDRKWMFCSLLIVFLHGFFPAPPLKPNSTCRMSSSKHWEYNSWRKGMDSWDKFRLRLGNSLDGKHRETMGGISTILTFSRSMALSLPHLLVLHIDLQTQTRM